MKVAISTHPRLLICEGHKDMCFFHRLIEERGLPKFHIVEASGNGGFFNTLSDIHLMETKRFKALRGILIVADNDDDPAGRFGSVCQQVERFFGRGTAPNAALQASRTTPPVTIMMIPWTNEHGHLEKLCVDSAESADGINAQQVDMFMGLIHAERWQSESRRGKAWLRVNLAARCVQDPFVPLGDVFLEARYRRLIPLNHPSFTRVADELAKLA